MRGGVEIDDLILDGAVGCAVDVVVVRLIVEEVEAQIFEPIVGAGDVDRHAGVEEAALGGAFLELCEL